MPIIVKNDQSKLKRINKKKVENFTRMILNSLNISKKAEVGILLVDNKKIQELNKKYRKLNRPTDVLAFAMQEGEKEYINPLILGDVVISIERAGEQAETYNHSFQEEFELLIIHGLLHLLGYDHLKKKDSVKMKAMENDLIKKFGSKL
ncbi:MAG: rRNA maturation RNase YbeY [Candidatus Firestonebacteria bacterium]|nr:rRNA maturation RNase YbeY [Candidatus Firestonebacteria bacterium]